MTPGGPRRRPDRDMPAALRVALAAACVASAAGCGGEDAGDGLRPDLAPPAAGDPVTLDIPGPKPPGDPTR